MKISLNYNALEDKRAIDLFSIDIFQKFLLSYIREHVDFRYEIVFALNLNVSGFVYLSFSYTS